MTFLSQVLQYAISGITGGSIYAVIGISWSLVYLISKVLNFTTGEFVMLGGMLTWVLTGAGFGLFSASLLAITCTIVVALLLERVAIRPMRYPTEMSYMMATIASASIIKGVVLLLWGSETRRIPPFFGTEVIQFFGATITSQILCVIGLLLLVTIGLSLFLNRTIVGKALRASAINLNGAELVGIDIKKFRLLCFGLAGGLGALTGIVITPITFTGYEIGILTGLKGLVAAIMGNWTMTGTVISALVLGLLEGFGAGFVSAGLKDVFALVVMIIILILRTVSFSPRSRRKTT